MYRGRIYWVSSKVIIPPSPKVGDLVQGEHPKIRVEYEWGAVFNRKPSIYLRRGKIGPRLLLMINRKSHTRFRLVPKSTTLDDAERPLRLCFKIHAFAEPTTKIWMKIDPQYQRQRCSPMTLVSGNRAYKVYADIRGGSLDRGRQTTVGLWKTASFSTFARYFVRSFRGKALLYSII